MQIRAYVRRLEKFLQQRFNKLNLSFSVSRRSKYVHTGLDIPLLSTRVSSELVAIIKDFEGENRGPKYSFVFPKLTSCRREDRGKVKNVKFINRFGKKIEGKIIFNRCYGHGVLLLTIDLEGFEFYQGRLFPIDW